LEISAMSRWSRIIPFGFVSARLAKSFVLVVLAIVVLGAGLTAAFAADPAGDAPLRIAVYDVPPYGAINGDGTIGGASVELWRRVAEKLSRRFELTAMSDIEPILSGLEQNRFDAAIGAITITPERLQRVDFSYPAHRSGVAVAFRRQTGPLAALASYGAAVSEFSPLIALILALLALTGLAMWLIETSHRALDRTAESAVATFRDGLYWAVVTMTTVGYGDKTPKSTAGRIVAVLWMLGSVVLVSLLSTSLVSRLTAEKVETSEQWRDVDLTGAKLAAVTGSSGAEYLDSLHLPYAKYRNLPDALDALRDKKFDAVVNSVGALQYFIAKRYASTLQAPSGLLAPAYMAFALPRQSPLRRPIDLALIAITADQEWRAAEDRYFGR
jgi:polar amino acid transport system substrate-binding protein